MNRSTATPIRDIYHRPGQQQQSPTAGKEGQQQTLTDNGNNNSSKTPFFTNLTSVNIATAFARAHITSDTISRRPAHLKGAPMSPSQIPKMNLADIPEHDDPRAHFEPSTNAQRPHNTIRPIRDITSKGYRTGTAPSYQGMDVDDSNDYSRQGGASSSVMPDGFLRDRNWDLPQSSAPGWLRRIQGQKTQTLAQMSPPPGILDTPSNVLGRSGIGMGSGSGAGISAPPFDALPDNLIDLKTPYAGDEHRNSNRNSNSNNKIHYYAEDDALTDTNVATGAPSIRASDDLRQVGGSYKTNGSLHARHANGRAYTNGNSNAVAADEADNQTNNADNDGASLYNRSQSTKQHQRQQREYYGHENEDDDAETEVVETVDYNADGRGSRAQSRYSLRSRVSTPGRLSYGRDFKPREEGHDQYVRKTAENTGKNSKAIPTPYTARIKGPGAFPATAQRFSQRRANSYHVSRDENVSPTAGRQHGSRSNIGGDLLSNHPYLSHGSGQHRGWDDYERRDGADGEQGSVHSFSDSFVSNSSAGRGGIDREFEHDNPTLLKRLVRNIAAGWSGSGGSLAERVSFVFFMVYFMVKESCTVIGSFVLRLLVNFVIGPIYSGVREVVLLPLSLWRLAAPGSSHETATTLTGILTGLTTVAISIVVSQYGTPVLSGLSALTPSIFGNKSASGRSPLSYKPPAGLEPLSDEDIERLGGHGSAVVDRLIHVEQTIKHLYGLLDALRSYREDETQDVRNSLKKLQHEKQSLMSDSASEKKRLDALEKEYSNLKRDVKARATKNTQSSGYTKEVKDIRQHVDRLTKKLEKALNDAVVRGKAQEKELKDMLRPEWLASDGDEAYANVARMIEAALNRYASDRLGKTDFALFSAGTRIIPGLTSPTFEPPVRGLVQRLWRKLGMISSQPPTAILDPNTHVGECWPMRGSNGQVAIHLTQPVDVLEFGIEHVAKSVAIDWRSAPRQIEVWGYVLGANVTLDGTVEPSAGKTAAATAATVAAAPETASATVSATVSATGVGTGFERSNSDSKEANGPGIIHNPPFAESSSAFGVGQLKHLASYEYEPSDTSPLQILPAQGDRAARVRTIILKIKSNWGHPDHTCLYRFRVHGQRVPP